LTDVSNLQQMPFLPCPAVYCLLSCDYHVFRVDNPIDRNSPEIIKLDQFCQTTSTGLQITADTDVES